VGNSIRMIILLLITFIKHVYITSTSISFKLVK